MMNKSKNTLVVVTGNKNKAKEIASITGCQIKTVKLDLPEIQSLNIEDVARAKAKLAFEQIKQPLIVDDTGMSIDALNGLPGAFVSWFLDALGTKGILELIKEKANREATVSTCIGYADENEIICFTGTIHGTIPLESIGKSGFGYDPIFIPKGGNKTFAQMSVEEKNSCSMRKIALQKLKEYLNKKG